jgi:hypothetical protein
MNKSIDHTFSLGLSILVILIALSCFSLQYMPINKMISVLEHELKSDLSHSIDTYNTMYNSDEVLQLMITVLNRDLQASVENDVFYLLNPMGEEVLDKTVIYLNDRKVQMHEIEKINLSMTSRYKITYHLKQSSNQMIISIKEQ